MGDWPLLEGQQFAAIGIDTSTSRGTGVTSAGAAHTKGSYIELTASTPFTAVGIMLNLQYRHWNVAVETALVDLAIGASGQEVDIVSNLMVTGDTSNVDCSIMPYLPIIIPEGSRLSARLQAKFASRALSISGLLVGQGFLPSQPGALIDTYGANTSTTRGTLINPGTSANTKGSWVQLTAATPRPIVALLLAFGNRGENYASEPDWLTDIGIGSAGQEVVLCPNIHHRVELTNETMLPGWCGPIPCTIPAGVRLVARAQSDLTTTDNLFDLVAYGVVA